MIVFRKPSPKDDPQIAAREPRNMRKSTATSLIFALGMGLIMPILAEASRVKDIAYLRGARPNQLIGYSLVVGLDGSGDSADSLLARKPLQNALERMAISIESEDVRGRSIAGVLVTATLPPFAKSGARIDVTVDALGDTISLRGGTLIYTLLHGANQVIYATAQGPITGIPAGIASQAPPQDDPQRNDPRRNDPRRNAVATKGFVIGGGLVERELELNLNTRSRIFINLHRSDFTTAYRLAKLINRELGDGSARAKDAGTIEVSVPSSYLGQTVELMSVIENLEITPDSVARVVVDERSGTIVMGQHVRVSPIAIAHGALNIQIDSPQTPTLPLPAGQNAAAPNPAAVRASSAGPTPQRPRILFFKGDLDLKELVEGLNKIGASTEDLIEVLKIIRSAGALHAELEIR